MSLATADNICDRILDLIEAQVPESLTADRFRRFRDEEGADFEAWAEKNVPGCFRRFHVIEVGDDELPETSSGVEERVRMRVEIRIVYPQTHRYGANNARSRRRVMNQDWKLINAAIGLYGGGNFSGDYDAIPLGATKTRESGGKVDYLVVMADFEYLRSIV